VLKVPLALRLGLAHLAHNFAHIADARLDELRKEISLGRGKSVYHSYKAEIKDISFDEPLKTRGVHKLYTLIDGYRPPSLNGTFRKIKRDIGLEKNGEDGQNRTPYSLRHTYAKLEPIENRTNINTLAKQMNNSALIIEKHYRKLTATMALDRLA
jgi:integrase